MREDEVGLMLFYCYKSLAVIGPHFFTFFILSIIYLRKEEFTLTIFIQ